MTKYPDKEHSLDMLVEWKDRHDALQAMFDGIESSMGLDPSGPLLVNVWNLFDAYSAGLARELGDTGDTWLSWFQADNDMGRRGLEAGYDGKLKPIKTLAHLYGLIADGRKRWDEA